MGHRKTIYYDDEIPKLGAPSSVPLTVCLTLSTGILPIIFTAPDTMLTAGTLSVNHTVKFTLI